MIPMILATSHMTVFANGQHTLPRDHPRFDEALAAVMSDDIDLFLDVINRDANILKGAGLVFDNGLVTYNGQEINGVLRSRLLEIHTKGFDITAWRNFVTKLFANPHFGAVEELYAWLEKADLPICDDGDFYAYKTVRNDYLDKHSGTLDYSVGNVVTMPGGRYAVDDDRRQECSIGLHFARKEYLSGYMGYDDRLLLVKINPADVVSVPFNETAKGRCWKMEVVEELDKGILSTGWSTPIYPAPVDDTDEDDVLGSDGPTSVSSEEDRCDDPNCWCNADDDDEYNDEAEAEAEDDPVCYICGEPMSQCSGDRQVDVVTPTQEAPETVEGPTFKSGGKLITLEELTEAWSLAEGSRAKLAAKLGVPESTTYRWLKRAGFKK